MKYLLALVLAATPVADVAKRGDRDSVRSLLREGADVNASHGDGMSALHWASSAGDAEMAAILVAAGANVKSVTRIGHYTPLHVACRGGNAAVVEVLLATVLLTPASHQREAGGSLRRFADTATLRHPADALS
jgi:ankyrin repeat protein